MSAQTCIFTWSTITQYATIFKSLIKRVVSSKMEKLAFLVILVLMASGMMTSATQVNEASEAEKQLIRVDEEQLKMTELYNLISAAMKSSNHEAPKGIKKVISCFSGGWPCVSDDECCSNNCMQPIRIISPAGICH